MICEQLTISRYSCWAGGGVGDVTRENGVESMKGVNMTTTLSKPGRNTIMTESTQESEHLQYMYFLVCGLDSADAIT